MIFIRPVNTRDLHFYSQKTARGRRRGRICSRYGGHPLCRRKRLCPQAAATAGPMREKRWSPGGYRREKIGRQKRTGTARRLPDGRARYAVTGKRAGRNTARVILSIKKPGSAANPAADGRERMTAARRRTATATADSGTTAAGRGCGRRPNAPGINRARRETGRRRPAFTEWTEWAAGKNGPPPGPVLFVCAGLLPARPGSTGAETRPKAGPVKMCKIFSEFT